MTSKAAIWNMALGHINADANINDPDADLGKEATTCRLFYDPVRRATLREHLWNFATERVFLEDMGANPSDWAKRYRVPDRMIRAWEIAKASRIAAKIPFEISGSRGPGGEDIKVLLTDHPQAELIYIKDVTNTELFDPGFVTVLSHRLASYLAMPLTGKRDIAGDQLQLFTSFLNIERATSANEGDEAPQPEAPWTGDYG